jgi:hypothetical protein
MPKLTKTEIAIISKETINRLKENYLNLCNEYKQRQDFIKLKNIIAQKYEHVRNFLLVTEKNEIFNHFYVNKRLDEKTKFVYSKHQIFNVEDFDTYIEEIAFDYYTNQKYSLNLNVKRDTTITLPQIPTLSEIENKLVLLNIYRNNDFDIDDFVSSFLV